MYKLIIWIQIFTIVIFIFTTVFYLNTNNNNDKQNTNFSPHSQNDLFKQDKISNIVKTNWEIYTKQRNQEDQYNNEARRELKELLSSGSDSDSSSDTNTDTDTDSDTDTHNHTQTPKPIITPTPNITQTPNSTESSSMVVTSNSTTTGIYTPIPTSNSSTIPPVDSSFDENEFNDYFDFHDGKSISCFSTLFNYRNNAMMFSSLADYVSNSLEQCQGCHTFPPPTTEAPSTTANEPPPPPNPTSTWDTPPQHPPPQCNASGCKPSVFPIPTIPPHNSFNHSGWEKLNFQIESFYLNPSNDVGRSCRFAGDKIIFGRVSNGPCGEDRRFIDCTYTCDEFDVVTPEFRKFITDILLPTTTEILSSMILVPSSKNNIKLNEAFWRSNNGECDNIQIPSKFISQGLNPGKNLLLYVTSRPVSKLDSIAYTLHCNCNYKVLGGNSFQYGRPLAGIINFSPKYFKLKKYNFERENTLNFQRGIQATLHEFIHLLGFDQAFYSSYLDKNGKPHVNPVVTKSMKHQNPSGGKFTKTSYYLNTPSVKWAIQRHFKCMDSRNVNGLQLEDLNSIDNSTLIPSHFSSHLFFGEIMTTAMNPTMTLSIFTLAVLQDMGWYVIDTSFSQEYLYGRNEGCDFLSNRCEKWNKARGYFCESGNFGCAPDRRSFSFCGVKEYPEPLEERFQHFKNPKLGGPRSHEFCPVLGYNSITKGVFCSQLPFNVTHPAVLGSTSFETYELLKNDSLTYTNTGFNFSSDNLRCFNFKVKNSSIDFSNCFHQECDYRKKVLRVSVKEKWFECPYEGGIIHDNRSEDISVDCPAYDTVCESLTLPILVPVGESLEEDKPTKKYWWKSPKFWIPMAGAVGLSLFLLTGGIFVYKKYFNKSSLSSTTNNAEMNSIHSDNATHSNVSDYSENSGGQLLY